MIFVILHLIVSCLSVFSSCLFLFVFFCFVFLGGSCLFPHRVLSKLDSIFHNILCHTVFALCVYVCVCVREREREQSPCCVNLNQIAHLLDSVMSESQCGFRSSQGWQGTVDMIVAIRNLQEECLEQYKDMYHPPLHQSNQSL